MMSFIQILITNLKNLNFKFKSTYRIAPFSSQLAGILGARFPGPGPGEILTVIMNSDIDINRLLIVKALT